MSTNRNFVDYVKVFFKSGSGGAGSVHFRREKYVPNGGPDGGDGGKGGSIILRGNAQRWTLLALKWTKHVKAEDGGNGGEQDLLFLVHPFHPPEPKRGDDDEQGAGCPEEFFQHGLVYLNE